MRADRIDLGDHDAGALALQRLRASLADITIAADHSDLAGQHHIGRAKNSVRERVTAAVQVVELALGYGVVDVDRGEEQRPRFHHLIEAVHTRRRLLGYSAQILGHARPALRILLELAAQQIEDDAVLFRILVGIELGHASDLLELDSPVNEKRRVSTVIQQQVWSRSVGPDERLVGAPPVLLLSLIHISEPTRLG